MSNTRQKLLAGLLLLVGLAFLAFQFIRSSRNQSNQTGNLPIRNNNPFALFQKFPSNWVGLIGNDNGFLKFDTVVNGVRAGFINLYRRYLAQGLDTISVIAPVYTGLADASGYASGLSKISGIGLNDKITESNVLRLARGIERMEEGRQWVTEVDFQRGFELAKTYLEK
ncbi:MAG TPA: hypothetical protein VFU05_13595 [Cyclobacteriaceae bacterium]|nr:hypothetical protein [Cyclobacteriaceae bacterium]